MKNVLFLFLVFTSFFSSLFGQSRVNHASDSGYAMVDTNRSSPIAYEQTMLKEINLVRKNPKGYIPYVQNYITVKKLTGAELTAANELITELGKQKSLPELKYDACIYKTAQKHAINQAPTGQIDHNDTKGNDPSKRLGTQCPQKFPEWVSVGGGTMVKNGRENLAWDVHYSGYGTDARRTNIQLLVDAGVPSRGHRKTILIDGATHCAAFVYEDYMPDGTRYDRWIQMFGKENTATTNTNGSSSSAGNSTTNQTPSSPPAGCPQTQPGTIAWPDLIDGKKVDKACWNYWWNNWKG